jgi:hypothetical protein
MVVAFPSSLAQSKVSAIRQQRRLRVELVSTHCRDDRLGLSGSSLRRVPTVHVAGATETVVLYTLVPAA